MILYHSYIKNKVLSPGGHNRKIGGGLYSPSNLLGLIADAILYRYIYMFHTFVQFKF